MSRRLFGIETEYGLSGAPPESAPGNTRCAERLVRNIAGRYPHLPSGLGSGIFLANGARVYVDTGGHPEYCTPELADPRELVCHVAAGSELLHLASSCGPVDEPVSQVLLFRCNVDYLSRSTWACHENYGHRANPLELPRQVIPHLVSRLVYTGAGGLDPFSHHISFCLSPRVLYLVKETSTTSTGDRGIYHLKDETLSAPGWHRMHVLCGDSLCSHLGTWLKVGTTALVVALAEAGLRPGESVVLKHPIDAMRTINRDLTLSRTVELVDGRRVTALDLQWHFFESVMRQVDRLELPAWTQELCRAWQDILERLGGGLSGVHTRLDWALKYALFNEHLGNRGIRADDLEAFTRNPTSPEGDAEKLPIQEDLPGLQLDPVTPPTPPQPAPPARPPLSQAQIKTMHAVRTELCELDLRFGQLGPHGVFSALDRAEILHHRIPGLSSADVDKAIERPPTFGRARLRGLMIRKLHRRRDHVCNWDSIWSATSERSLDLSDPLLNKMPPWKSMPPPSSSCFGTDLNQFLDHIFTRFEHGDYESAHVFLESFAGPPGELYGPARSRFLGLVAAVESRRGFFPNARSALESRFHGQVSSFTAIYAYTALHRHRSLGPGEEIWPWIARGDAFLAEAESEPLEFFKFRNHKGFALLHAGRLAEARDLLSQSLENNTVQRIGPRIHALMAGDLGEVCRRLGNTEQAAFWLREAERIQTASSYRGDLANFTLLNRAKLESASTDVGGLLSRARRLQDDSMDRMGQARTLLLMARLAPGAVSPDNLKQEVSRLQRELPSLLECPVANTILANWSTWCEGGPCPAGGDTFWGL